MILTKLALGIVLLSILFTSVPAFADDTCLLSVRSIAGVNGPETKGSSDELIPELEQQLGAMPFKHYRIVQSVERKFSGKEEQLLTLSGCTGSEHTLKIQPGHRTKRGILFTVDWNGPDGESLLSTRLNLVNGRTVFVGTEETSKESTVLGIRVDCK